MAGPTASGKSALALRLAQDTPIAIINADSLQVYKDLTLLTAYPSPHDRETCPHFLYGFLKAEERFSVSAWLEKAKDAYHQCQQKNLLPVFVGGTGLYFKALQDGLTYVPPIQREIKESLHKRLINEGSPSLHQELTHLCPEEGAKLNPQDSARVVRRLEVLKSTGKSLSWWQTQPPLPSFLETKPKNIVVLPERDFLYAQAERRFDQMMERGALQQVQTLQESLTPSPDISAKKAFEALPVSKAIGAKPLASALRNEITLEEAIQQGKQETRNYIKRQMTWFRHQMNADLILNKPDPANNYSRLKGCE